MQTLKEKIEPLTRIVLFEKSIECKMRKKFDSVRDSLFPGITVMGRVYLIDYETIFQEILKDELNKQ